MEKVGIENSVSCVAGLRALALSAIDLSKSGSFFTRIPKTLSLVAAIYALAKEASNVLPELQDLDAEESGSLAQSVYQAARDVIMAAGGASK